MDALSGGAVKVHSDSLSEQKERILNDVHYCITVCCVFGDVRKSMT